MAESTTDGKAGQVRIQLSTRQPDIELPDDLGPLLVSAGFKRYQLSTLVNNILQTERPTPFEFLINGQFLRTTVDEFLTANGISAETTLDVEYVRASVPPVHVTSYEHDAWVSSVDVLSGSSPAGSSRVVSGQERILSGGYDGLFRVWDMSGNVVATAPADGGHTLAVKAVKFLSDGEIVSASMDRSIRLWNYDGQAGSIMPALELYGHKRSVESLAVHAPSRRILSASSDGTIGYWSTDPSEAPDAPDALLPTPASKKRKLPRAAGSKAAPQRGPLSLLAGHKVGTQSALFAPHDRTVAHSASLDHTVRTWDLTTSTCVSTRATQHPLAALAALPGVGLLAAGSTARHVALVDPRESAASVAAMTLRGHANAVVALDCDPASAHRLVSASHDGTCRVWDVRSVRAAAGGAAPELGGLVGESLYVLQREGARGMPPGGDGVKVFGVRWDRDVGIVSGGEDKKVQVNREAEAASGS